MTREIKFRAWDNENKAMHYDKNLLFDGKSSQLLSGHSGSWSDSAIIMRFTGLHDKNGVEIYEGDIVRTQEYTDKPLSRHRKHQRHIGVVIYHIGKGDGFYSETSKKFDRHDEYEAGWDVEIADKGKFQCSNWGPFYDCEVIGNIHENPELMGEG